MSGRGRATLALSCNICMYGVRRNWLLLVLSLSRSAWSVSHAVAAFQASEWGVEYLQLEIGDIVKLVPAPEGLDAAGWLFVESVRGDGAGWVPPAYLMEMM